MRLILMGTGPFAVPTFRTLLTSSHAVLALVTRPTGPVQTRGKSRPAPNPVRDLAQEYGLAVLASEDINAAAAQQQLSELHPELFVVCDYGQILSADTLRIAPLGGINLHGSLLPKYRGAAPLNWAIWRGETKTGVTVLHMTPHLDAGPCLVQLATEIGDDETAAELEPRLAQLGVPAVHEAIDLLSRWDRQSPLGWLQDPAHASRARRLKKEDGRINWSQPAIEIYRQFRALQPWPGIHCYWQGRSREPLRLLVTGMHVERLATSAAPGTISESGERRLVVVTGDGALCIDQLQPAGKRVMAVDEFLRGYRPQVGDHFDT